MTTKSKGGTTIISFQAAKYCSKQREHFFKIQYFYAWGRNITQNKLISYEDKGSEY